MGQCEGRCYKSTEDLDVARTDVVNPRNAPRDVVPGGEAPMPRTEEDAPPDSTAVRLEDLALKKKNQADETPDWTPIETERRADVPDEEKSAGLAASPPEPPPAGPTSTQQEQDTTSMASHKEVATNGKSSSQATSSATKPRRSSLSNMVVGMAKWPRWGTAKASLSPNAREKVEALFRKMDLDDSKTVTFEEAMKFFQGSFKKFSAEGMFNEVDVDRNGAITLDEFVGFWQQVRSAGYSEKDILDELDQLFEGSAWVDFDDGRTTEKKMTTPSAKLLKGS
mmetsp:Transcript_112978/g.319560  ORF Transcript_112978/g.319560 Transcript_112978/m.319560 type:complete len:281 (-) Transcript_112978:129-971(-)